MKSVTVNSDDKAIQLSLLEPHNHNSSVSGIVLLK